MLFAIEASGSDVEAVIYDFWRELPADAEGRSYADEVVRGVREHEQTLDQRIAASSRNWKLSRMTRVDRNILRIGAWELFYRFDVPRAVILDEAVEVAKRFGTAESGSFVNGVLGRVAEESGRPEDQPKAGEDG